MPPIVLLTSSLGALLSGLGFVLIAMTRSRNHWRREADAWQIRASASHANNCARERIVEAKDETIASLTAQRDKYEAQAEGMARQLAAPAGVVMAWNARHPNRPIAGVSGLTEAAWVRNAKGRLERLMPTNG